MSFWRNAFKFVRRAVVAALKQVPVVGWAVEAAQDTYVELENDAEHRRLNSALVRVREEVLVEVEKRILEAGAEERMQIVREAAAGDLAAAIAQANLERGGTEVAVPETQARTARISESSTSRVSLTDDAIASAVVSQLVNSLRRNSWGSWSIASKQGTTNALADPRRIAQLVAQSFPVRLPPLAPGQKVPGSDWELEAPLASGGFGAAWLARDLHEPGLKSVFKFPLDPEAVATLDAEARNLKRLERLARHPNIVAVRGSNTRGATGAIGTVGGPFVQMDFIDGGTLRDWLIAQGQTPPPREDVIRLFDGIVDGMAAAHEADVIHRDLKPDNILLRADGTPVIADFGIGRVAAATVRMSQSGQLTKADLFAGFHTIGYASSAQREGLPARKWFDVHALCVMLGEIVLGDPVVLEGRGESGSLLTALKRLLKRDSADRWVARVRTLIEEGIDDEGELTDAVVLREQWNGIAVTTAEPAHPPGSAVTQDAEFGVIEPPRRIEPTLRTSSRPDHLSLEQLADATQTAENTLDLSDLTYLTHERCGKIATWGHNDDEWRELQLGGLTTLEPEAAAQLATWGRGCGGDRFLYLDGLILLPAPAARHLATWGRGEQGWRNLHLGGLDWGGLDEESLDALLAWGSGDKDNRTLGLDGLRQIDSKAACRLAAWGRGDNADRSLYLSGLKYLDLTSLRELMAWGKHEKASRYLILGANVSADSTSLGVVSVWGDSDLGDRSLSLPGIAALDASARSQLANWGRLSRGRRDLMLPGLTVIDASFRAFATSWGVLAPGSRCLSLRGLTSLDAASASIIAEWGTYDLGLRVLDLSEVQLLDAAAAAALAAWGEKASPPRPRKLDLTGLTYVSASVARSLGLWEETDFRELQIEESVRAEIIRAHW